MLVLSRRSQQSVLIGGRIKVTVLNITHSYVELGIEAPAHIAVDREEIHLRKLAAKNVVRIVRRAPLTTASSASPAGRGEGEGIQGDEPSPPDLPRRSRDR